MSKQQIYVLDDSVLIAGPIHLVLLMGLTGKQADGEPAGGQAGCQMKILF